MAEIVPWRGACGGGGTFSVAAKKPLAGFCVLLMPGNFVYNSYVKNLPNRVHDLRQPYAQRVLIPPPVITNSHVERPRPQ
jgi:hypothetical protein